MLGAALQEVEGRAGVLAHRPRRVTQRAGRVGNAAEVEHGVGAGHELADRGIAGVHQLRAHLLERGPAPAPGPRDGDDLVAPVSQQRRQPRAEEAGGPRDQQPHESLPQIAGQLVAVLERARHGPFRAAGDPLPASERRHLGNGHRLRGDVVARHARRARRLEQDPRHVLDMDHADRRPAAVVERQLLAVGREPPKLVHDRLRLRPRVLDRSGAVDDPEPEQRQVEAVAASVQLEAQLGVDLRQVRQVALAAVGTVGADLAPKLRAVDMQRAAVDDRRRPVLGHRLGHDPGAAEVGLLRVSGVRLREGAARLRGQQVDAVPAPLEQSPHPDRVAHVGRLHARPTLLQPAELLTLRRVPVVGEHHLVTLHERAGGEHRADVPGPEHE